MSAITHIVRTVTKIKLSLLRPPVIVTFSVNEATGNDKFNAGGRRILSIDLAENQGPIYSSNSPDPILPPRPKPSPEDQYARPYELDYDPTDYGNPDKGTGIYASILLPANLPGNKEANKKRDDLRNEKMLRDIRKVVADDSQLPPDQRVDTVEIGPEPWSEHLAALDGLSPKHLKATAGFDEQIDLYALTVLANPWTELESLHLVDECTGWSSHTPSSGSENGDYSGLVANYPSLIKQVKSLTLDYCCGFRFEADNLPHKLQHLKIVENDATTMFAHACMNITGLTERLETLYIRSTGGCDFGNLDEFRQHLVKCMNIRDITLVLGGRQETDLGLVKSIPSSVEKLAFHCSTSDKMLDDFDSWIESAADSAWLPSLKTISITTDGGDVNSLSKKKRQDDLAPSKAAEFERKIKAITSTLEARGVLIDHKD